MSPDPDIIEKARELIGGIDWTAGKTPDQVSDAIAAFGQSIRDEERVLSRDGFTTTSDAALDAAYLLSTAESSADREGGSAQQTGEILMMYVTGGDSLEDTIAYLNEDLALPAVPNGVLVCLAALCTAASLKMDDAGEAELTRIWTKVEKIRAKHAAKPQFSPLPGLAASPATGGA